MVLRLSEFRLIRRSQKSSRGAATHTNLEVGAGLIQIGSEGSASGSGSNNGSIPAVHQNQPVVSGMDMSTSYDNGNHVNMHAVGSEVEEGDVGNPQHSVSATSTEMGERSIRTQMICEPGASYYEVKAIWCAKRCTQSARASFCKMGLWGSLVLLLCVVVGVAAWKYQHTSELEVKKFLKEIEMEEYFEDFIREKYVWLEDVIHISRAEDLKSIGINYKAQQDRLLRYAEKLRTRKSVLTTVMWTMVIAIAVIVLTLATSVLIFQEARNRASCLFLWCCFMFWHRVRMYCRLWQKLDTNLRPICGSRVEEDPQTPNSDVNPPNIASPGNTPGPHVVE